MTDATRAFLRRLPRDGFVPAERDVAALGTATLPLPPAALARRGDDEVRSFVAEFWSLAPADREERYHALRESTYGPAAEARLGELRRGVRVEVVRHADPDAGELAALVRELFVLAAPARAARRLAWLAERRDELRRWAAAARLLRDADRPLARLEPVLFRWLGIGRVPRPIDRAVYRAVRNRNRAAVRETWRQADRTKTWSIRALMVFIPVIAVMGGAVFLFMHTHLPAPHEKAHRARQLDQPRFNLSEVLMFNAYDVFPAGWAPPARYDTWVAAGRPGVVMEKAK